MVTQVMHEEVRIIEQVEGTTFGRRRLRDAFVFLAGASTFHALSHVWLGLSGLLPMEIKFPSMTLTQNLNLIAIVVNGLITVGLLYAARRVTK